MIVVDSSALCAILFGEPERPSFEALIAARRSLLPVSCLVETAITWRRRGGPAHLLDRLIDVMALRVIAVDEGQARLAVEADRRYGRGTGHPANLNFGDCLAYAAAVVHGAPLLFKGDGFIHTDVDRAL